MTIFHVIKYSDFRAGSPSRLPLWVVEQYADSTRQWAEPLDYRDIKLLNQQLDRRVRALLLEYDPDIHGEAIFDDDFV